MDIANRCQNNIHYILTVMFDMNVAEFGDKSTEFFTNCNNNTVKFVQFQ